MKKIFTYLFICQIFSNLYALTFGVVPQQSPFVLMKAWSPIIQYLEKETGEKIDLKIETSIPKFEEILYSGGYDIAYMNPYHYIVANEKKDYRAIVKSDKDLVGILVVNKTSGLTQIDELKGKKFLFPSPNALAATLLTKYELSKKYHINIEKDEQFDYVNSHDSVYKGVSRGIGDVGGGIERTFDALNDEKTKDSLTILYKTESYPSHPIAFNKSISKELEEKFIKALINIPENLLKELSIDHIIQTNDKEYDVIRDITNELSLPKQ